MNDPLDIKLTAQDVVDMDPNMLVGMYEKLRADRNDLREQRTNDARMLRYKEECISDLMEIKRDLEKSVSTRDAALAEVGLRMIQCGMVQHMCSTFMDDQGKGE